MTDRDAQRRKAFQDQAPGDPPLTALSDLCVIRGCLCLKQGNNLCHHHSNDLKDDRCRPT